MATSDIEKVLTVFRGIGNGDPDLAIEYMHPTKYTQHARSRLTASME
jgi:hypothetical protein